MSWIWTEEPIDGPAPVSPTNSNNGGPSVFDFVSVTLRSAAIGGLNGSWAFPRVLGNPWIVGKVPPNRTDVFVPTLFCIFLHKSLINPPFRPLASQDKGPSIRCGHHCKAERQHRKNFRVTCSQSNNTPMTESDPPTSINQRRDIQFFGPQGYTNPLPTDARDELTRRSPSKGAQ
jgi:hypothetical protein